MLNKLWLDDCRPAPEGWTWHFHVDDMIDDMIDNISYIKLNSYLNLDKDN